MPDVLCITLSHVNDVLLYLDLFTPRALEPTPTLLAERERDLVTRASRARVASQRVARHQEECVVVAQGSSCVTPQVRECFAKGCEGLRAHFEGQDVLAQARILRSLWGVAQLPPRNASFELSYGLSARELTPRLLGFCSCDTSQLSQTGPIQFAFAQVRAQQRQ
jgi:hypothetical protein